MSDTNTGNWNTGDWNTGNRNTGDWNTGDWNTGNRNTGDWNTGYWNTGYCNTGNWNTGDWNTGNRNTGYCNTGDWNTGDWNTGYCNTITPEACLIFNKHAFRKDWDNATKPDWMYADLTRWIDEFNMTDKEKDAYPSYATTGGYLKAYASLQDAFKEAWEEADEDDRRLTEKLPNYDATVFEELFGFKPYFRNTTCAGKIVEIEGVKYKLEEV